MPNEEGLYTKDEVQAMIRERLAAKETTILALTKERDEATRQATTAAARIAKAEGVALNAAFKMAGIPEDATIRRGFELFYNEAMASVAEVDRPSLADWVGSTAAKEHPMLKAHFTTPEPTTTPTTPEGGDTPPATDPPADPATTTPPTAATGTTPPTSPPNGNAGAGDPPTKSQKMTPEQLQAYLRSDEYRALPADKQKERFNALKAELGHGDLFDGGGQLQSVLPQRAG